VPAPAPEDVDGVIRQLRREGGAVEFRRDRLPTDVAGWFADVAAAASAAGIEVAVFESATHVAIVDVEA
jgi:hypothetical protein